MKTEDLKSLNLEQIVNALKEQNLKKYDIVVPSHLIEMKDSNLVVINPNKVDELSKILMESGIEIDREGLGIENITLTPLEPCHAQIASRLDIPKRYYDRMLLNEKNHGLLDMNVRHWFRNHKENKNFLIRTFVDRDEKAGIARAILSDRYNILDNYDVMLATLEAIRESGLNVQIESGDITDKKFFMRFTCPDIEIDAPEILKNYRVPNSGNSGNGIITGFVISNSETGFGKFTISPRAVVLACSNGMIFRNDAFQKTHLGSKMDGYSTIDWSEQTRQKNYELVISQVKDAINTFASKEYLGARINEIIEKGNRELEHPMEAVKNVSRHLKISEEKEKSILNYFVKGSDTNAFGVTQALTYYAQHDADPEERFEIENKAVYILDEMDKFDTADLVTV